MTRAQQLIAFYTGDLNDNGERDFDYAAAQAEAEQIAVTTEYGPENEATDIFYIFADGSCIVDCNGTMTAYGSVD